VLISRSCGTRIFPAALMASNCLNGPLSSHVSAPYSRDTLVVWGENSSLFCVYFRGHIGGSGCQLPPAGKEQDQEADKERHG
jgi:hypothetical protein